ncbi:uncharacterized protein CCOS01_00637 [Colletotrichum costaricense]|uniref:Uncharacterized protein n=1 Tax=Colletotrichum costaricense TaxID=1209916 RepID=A0AAI9Z9F4_9PEZI|nr:uncharacterized protein CCOS01_00637 [Colletotrichum costaricense]KAK1539323.1 hypothetical protein CCOS01_00637 [Colletotrichum costaricense]
MEVRGRVRSDAECGGSAVGPVMSRLNQFSAASREWPAQLLGEAANQMPSKPFCLRMGELKETGVIGTGFSSAHSAHAQLPVHTAADDLFQGRLERSYPLSAHPGVAAGYGVWLLSRNAKSPLAFR